MVNSTQRWASAPGEHAFSTLYTVVQSRQCRVLATPVPQSGSVFWSTTSVLVWHVRGCQAKWTLGSSEQEVNWSSSVHERCTLLCTDDSVQAPKRKKPLSDNSLQSVGILMPALQLRSGHFSSARNSFLLLKSSQAKHFMSITKFCFSVRYIASIEGTVVLTAAARCIHRINMMGKGDGSEHLAGNCPGRKLRRSMAHFRKTDWKIPVNGETDGAVQTFALHAGTRICWHYSSGQPFMVLWKIGSALKAKGATGKQTIKAFGENLPDRTGFDLRHLPFQ